jgi:hypothetical protein
MRLLNLMSRADALIVIDLLGSTDRSSRPAWKAKTWRLPRRVAMASRASALEIGLKVSGRAPGREAAIGASRPEWNRDERSWFHPFGAPECVDPAGLSRYFWPTERRWPYGFHPFPAEPLCRYLEAGRRVWPHVSTPSSAASCRQKRALHEWRSTF